MSEASKVAKVDYDDLLFECLLGPILRAKIFLSVLRASALNRPKLRLTAASGVLTRRRGSPKLRA
jgi:hypothetical protein